MEFCVNYLIFDDLEHNFSNAQAIVPTVREMLKLAPRTQKNFIQINALDTILTVPKVPKEMMVDNRHGDKILLETSGLVPKYRTKKVFLDD